MESAFQRRGANLGLSPAVAAIALWNEPASAIGDSAIGEDHKNIDSVLSIL
jgi:hypothetical protein